MEHPYIDDEHVVDHYLAGDLPDEDVERFEEHLFECKTCLEAVEWGEELRRGVRAVAAPDSDSGLYRIDEEDDSNLSAEIGLVSKPWLASPAGRPLFAAMGLMLVGLVALGLVAMRQSAELTRLRDAPAVAEGFSEPIADFQVASLGVVRDAGAAVIRLDPARSAVLLSLELSAVTAAGYRVTIHDRSEQVVWRGEGLEPSLYDTLMIAVPSSFLSPGEYRATIESLPFSTGGTVDTLEFRVVADRMSGR